MSYTCTVNEPGDAGGPTEAMIGDDEFDTIEGAAQAAWEMAVNFTNVHHIRVYDSDGNQVAGQLVGGMLACF